MQHERWCVESGASNQILAASGRPGGAAGWLGAIAHESRMQLSGCASLAGCSGLVRPGGPVGLSADRGTIP